MPRAIQRVLLAASILIASGVPSISADLPTSVSAVTTAISDRLAAIGPSPAGDAKRESVRLARAASALADWAGPETKSGFRTAGKAGKLVVKSGTTDATVRAASTGLLFDLADLVAADDGPVAESLSLLMVEPYRAKVITIRARASDLLALGRERVVDDPAKAARLFWKSRKTFRKAAAKGTALLAAGGGPLPPGITVRDGYLWIENRSKAVYYLREIVITGTFRNETTGFVTLEVDRVTADASTSYGLPATIEPSTVPPITPTVHRLDEYLDEFRWRKTPVPLYSTEPHEFEGTLILVISTRRKEKAGDLAWRVPVRR